MIKKNMATSVAISTMLLIAGCGGGSSDSGDSSGSGGDVAATGTAYYVDSAVSGINYICGAEAGITGADGAFTFETGSNCTFYLGDMELRGVDAGLLVNGENVYETDVEIARILQSLDSDGNPDNGITISEDAVAALAEAGITSLPTTEAQMDEMLQVIDDNGGTNVNEEDASAHLLATLLAGNTLYTTIYDEAGTVESWTFNADITSATWREIVGGNESGTVTLTLDGMTMTLIDDGETDTIVVTEILEDYMLVSVDGRALQKLYYDEAKARADDGGEITVVTKTITIDGGISDWEGIEPVIMDPAGDVPVYSGLDISAIYVAQDANNFYVRVDRVSSTDLPGSEEFYNYWIKFKHNDTTDFAIEAFHDPESYIRLHKGDYNIVIGQLNSHVGGIHMEFSIPKEYIDFTEYTIEYFTHHTVDHGWKDDNGECGCDASPILLF